jgi:competence protein ComEC
MKVWKKLVLAVLVVGAAFVWYAVVKVEAFSDRLLVAVMDVGQGDAIFIQSNSGTQVLIDGGPDNKILSRLGEVMPFWDRSIDLVILTHPHSDHLMGLLEVLKRYKIGKVIETNVNYQSAEYEAWHRILVQNNVPVEIAASGKRVYLSEDTYVNFLTPFHSFEGQSPKNVHDAMIVSKLIYGATSVMFAGDAERELEGQLVFLGGDLKSNILKIGHHGSKTSTTGEFLAAVAPSIAVISSGKDNKYGHPTQEVLDRLKNSGVTTLRTDVDGSVKIVIDGHSFTLAK